MTFLKYPVYKTKNNISSNFWKLIFLKIFVRVFGILTFLYLLNFFATATFELLKDYYTAVSVIFYLSFFVFLDNMIKVSSSFLLSEKLAKPLRLLKWIPFLMMVFLMYSSVVINQNELSKISFATPAFLWKNVAPVIIIPNISFIMITILIFFVSAVLDNNSKLKQENDLTI